MGSIRSRLTYSNVVSTLCLFLLLGGGAYAAFHLPRNSVRSRHIVNGQVKSADVKDDSLTGTDILESSLQGPLFNGAAAGGDLKGTYPNPHLKPEIVLGSAGLADIDPGTCTFTPDQWLDLSADVNNQVSFTRDPLGRVHLNGIAAKCGSGSNTIFTLPAGSQPANLEHLGTVAADAFGEVLVDPSGNVIAAAGNFDHSTGGWISLDGLSFRCGPSGQDGCP